MHKINVEVQKSGRNYCCGYTEKGVGTIFCTSKSLDGLKAAFVEALEFHVEGMLADGEELPEWLAGKDYGINLLVKE